MTVNGGYGSLESEYEQSVAVMDTRTGKVTDYPDARTGVNSRQVLFSGLAFSADGKRLYGSIVSGGDPTGAQGSDTGSGVQVYGFDEGKLTRERVIRIAPQKLAEGKTTLLKVPGGSGFGMPYPAAVAVWDHFTPARATAKSMEEQLLVADQLSDDVLQIDAASGRVVKRFDLSESATVPGTYPVAVAMTPDGNRAFVALWNASEVVELDLGKGTVRAKLALLKQSDPVKPGSHPDALVLAPDGKTLYAALGNRDAVAALDVSEGGFRLKGYFDVRLPGQSFFGAEPEALAVSADGSRLYVADMASDAVAVLDTRKLTKGVAGKRMVEPMGFIPTEWLPMGVAFAGGKVYVATGKGTGTGPNNFPQKPAEGLKKPTRSFAYIATLLHGSIAAVDAGEAERRLKEMTAETLLANRMKAGEEKIAWDAGVLTRAPASKAGPIQHVIYIIRENRTYDQVLGDLAFGGKPVGNGDASLAMYGEPTSRRTFTSW